MESLCVNGICPGVIETALLSKSEAVEGSSDSCTKSTASATVPTG